MKYKSTQTVERHVTASAQYRQSLACELQGLEDSVIKARTDPTQLTWVYSRGMAVAQLGAVVDVRSPNVVRGMRLAAEAAAANFLLVGKRRGDRSKIRLDGEAVAWKAAKPALSYLTPGDWLKAFFMALVCRETKLLDQLCCFSDDDLRQSAPDSAEYRFLLVDGLRQAWRGKHPSDALVAAMEATDPERPDVRDRMNAARVIALDVPVIRLAYYLASADADFGKIHAEAIRQHKAFWTSNSRHKISWHGFLSIELTGLAAWAQDWELGAMTVSSDYAPAYLVSGDFLDE